MDTNAPLLEAGYFMGILFLGGFIIIWVINTLWKRVVKWWFGDSDTPRN